ncbi:MAG: hypothetical protein KGQ49_00470, partial [Verrucomicrobia bacterium]|nr:hypothetical protein [Verrucomicrobiota bacterium]
NCPITAEFPKDPVVTNCGHLFEKALLQQWQTRSNSCPTCKASLTQLTSVYDLRRFVDERLPKDPVPTCSHFKGQNQQRAAKYFELAQMCIAGKDYTEALACYRSALQHTNASADYAPIPTLYDQLREPTKATLSRLYLSLYQLQENKIQEAIETLKFCERDDFSSLIAGLKLQSCPSLENIEWAMKEASAQNNSDDSIFIYKQIIAHAPDRWDAYQQLIPLIKDSKEKKELLLTAAERARGAGQIEWETLFRNQVEMPLISDVIRKKQWAAAKTINLPPYPRALQDFLEGDCTIWPGKKRSETHIVVPLFPQVAINDDPIPSTLISLDQLDKDSGGPGYKLFVPDERRDLLAMPTALPPAEPNFCYAVMTKGVIPGSRNKSYDAQLKLLPSGYTIPGVFDAARAILWEHRHSGTRCFNNSPETYTRCKEDASIFRQDLYWSLFHFVVGGFGPSGLRIGVGREVVNESIGIAGWKKFDP